MRRRLNTRRGERGSALILAIFILFAMLALGMLAMRSATQNMSGSGNLRLAKQVRYVAEAGLYHAITLMNREGPNLLRLRDVPGLDGSTFLVESPEPEDGAAGRSRVHLRDENGAQRSTIDQSAPPILSGEPAALGVFGAGSGLVPSYEVVISGFQPWGCPPGIDETALREQGQGCCLVHFESRGLISSEERPEEDDLDTEIAAERFAEHVVKAGVVLGPFSLRGCSR